MRLYYAPDVAPTPRWLLEELGANYEAVEVAGDHVPEGLERRFDGPVATLVDHNVTVYHAPAICCYLAERFQHRRLAPEPGTEARGSYDQWMKYAIATLEPPLLQLSLDIHDADARTLFVERARLIEERLCDRRYILGDADEDFCAADVMLASLGLWAKGMDLLEQLPCFKAYVERMTARPAFERAIA